MSNRIRLGGHSVRPNVAVISGVIVAVLLVAAVYDASTDGIASMVALGSTVVVPLVAAFVNVVFGHEPPTYPKDAMVPALATFGSVIGVSLAFGGWALNWLWMTIFWSLLSASIGFAIGNKVRSIRNARSQRR